MKQILSLLSLSLIASTAAFSQTNITVTNPEAEQIILGNYTPTTYPGLDNVANHEDILCNLQSQISTDSMLNSLEVLQSYYTRQTHSDTVSSNFGIGAARRWAYGKLQGYSAAGSGRLIASYLNFDHATGSCGPAFDLKNVLGVLPGADPTNPAVIIIEAHMDSRCEDGCDVNCYAPGMEDNASGVALVLELARIMSRYAYDNTIIFMLTVGEEQGLLGGEAMSKYCVDNNVILKGVLNNDVIGGVECGETSSAPSCPGLGDIDSLQVRIFSAASNFATSRNLARLVKLYYDEKIVDVVDVPMTVSIMNQEDRTGRGGDHIPFRQDGFRSIRFTSANEHGNGNVADTNYMDRQHTSGDVLGIDTTGNLEIDKYYVNLNYLKRNAVINGSMLALLGSGPVAPVIEMFDEPTGIRVTMEPQADFAEYRIGVRTNSGITYFDEIYRTTDTSFIIPNQVAATPRFVSVAAIDAEGITGPFSREFFAGSNVATAPGTLDDLPYGIDCEVAGLSDFEKAQMSPYSLNCYPNPWGESTTITVTPRNESAVGQRGVIEVRDMQGRIHTRSEISLNSGQNSISIQEQLESGMYTYSLLVEGAVVQTKRMVKLR